MKLQWDYSELAKNYHKRAPYSKKLIMDVIDMTGINENSIVCDVGAGTGFLAREFAVNKTVVKAIEPNKEMQKIGQLDCAKWPSIEWFTGHAEKTQLADSSVDMVSFGSSFNVVDRGLALTEAARICRPNGWFLAVWNHRDLTSGLQFGIEQYIKQRIPSYQYGLRRIDQHDYLENSGFFTSVQSIRSGFTYKQCKADVIRAWHSHATLQRQAGDLHQSILAGITAKIENEGTELIETEFYTQAWLAQFKAH